MALSVFGQVLANAVSGELKMSATEVMTVLLRKFMIRILLKMLHQLNNGAKLVSVGGNLGHGLIKYRLAQIEHEPVCPGKDGHRMHQI